MPRRTPGTSLVELRTIEAGMRHAAEACRTIPAHVRGDAHTFINSTAVRVSDLRSLALAHDRLLREIRRRRGAETAEDRAADAGIVVPDDVAANLRRVIAETRAELARLEIALRRT